MAISSLFQSRQANSYIAELPVADTLYKANLALEPGYYTMTTSANINFILQLNSSTVLESSTTNNTITFNLANGADYIVMSSTSSNVRVTITAIGFNLGATTVFSNLLETYNSSTTYSFNGEAYIVAIGGGGGGRNGAAFIGGAGGGSGGVAIVGPVSVSSGDAIVVGSGGNAGGNGGASSFKNAVANGGGSTAGTPGGGAGGGGGQSGADGGVGTKGVG